MSAAEPEYLRLNRGFWDSRAAAHALGYGVERYLTDPELLSGVVRFDQPRLGDISGLDVVHLQCHIGSDTLSLHRLGARMTGLDFSPASLEQARALAAGAGADITYVESDVYAAADALGRQFDMVYTGIGVLGWLPSVDRWAEQVAAVLKPGGRFFMREGHPYLWTLDEDASERLSVRYSYFEHEEPIAFTSSDTYVEVPVELDERTTLEWNHGLAEIMTALMDQGLAITAIEEHESVPWEALEGQMVQNSDDEEFRLVPGHPRIPLSWTLQAVKR